MILWSEEERNLILIFLDLDLFDTGAMCLTFIFFCSVYLFIRLVFGVENVNKITKIIIIFLIFNFLYKNNLL